MTRSFRYGPLLAAALALAATACSDSTSSTTTPTPTTTSETFTATVVQDGTAGYPFTVATTGPLRVGLISVEPLANMSLGISLSSWSGTSCLATYTQNNDARTGIIALSGEITPGNYCVNVYDSGNIAADTVVSFSVEIIHP